MWKAGVGFKAGVPYSAVSAIRTHFLICCLRQMLEVCSNIMNHWHVLESGLCLKEMG